MPAIAHTIVCRFFTGTPSRLARSARSAAARMATPTEVRCRKRPMPRIAIGAITSTRRSLALNTSGSTRKVKSNGGSRRCDRTFSPKRSGQEQTAEREQLGEPERRDREDEPRRPEEAADDQQLARRAERDRHGEPRAERDQPRKARGDDDHHRQRGRDVAEVGLGEVEDPVGAVHERHAHAHHRGEQPDEHAAQRDAGGDRERDHLEEQDQDGGSEGPADATGAVLQGAAPQRSQSEP